MLDQQAGHQVMKGSARVPLSGLDALKGRLSRLQESPAFGEGIVERTPQAHSNHSADLSVLSDSHHIKPANLYQSSPNQSLSLLHTTQESPKKLIVYSQPRKAAESLLHDDEADYLEPNGDILNLQDQDESSNDIASADRMRTLESRLKVTQEMYNQMASENDRVLRDKERIENEVEKLQSTLKSKQGATNGGPSEPDVVYAQGSVFARKEVDVMQQQMKVTCQEIIKLRKAAASKEEECRNLVERHQKESATLRAELFQAETDLAKLRAQNSSESAEKVHDLKMKGYELSEDLKRANRALEDLEKSKAGLEEESRSAAEKIIQMGETQAEMGSEIARLKNVIVDQGREKLDLQKALALKDETIVQKENEYSDLEETLQSVESELGEAKEMIADLQEKEGSLQAQVAELEAVVEDFKEKSELDQKTILDLGRSNQDLTIQNQKLAVDIPQRMQTHIDALQKDTLEAKAIRDKQVKRLEKKLEKRETEIAHLRKVWRSLLTSHPEIDQAAEAAVDELRELSKTNKQLEAHINELQEQNEGLTMNYAITYIRLMLANWRRPLYLKRLKQSISELAEEEARLEAEEQQRELGGTQHFSAAQPQATTTLSPSKRRSVVTAFSTAEANMPETSSACVGDAHQGEYDHASANSDQDDEVDDMGNGSVRQAAMDPVRYKALQEGRAKYNAAVQKPRYATDVTAQEEEETVASAASDAEEKLSRTPDASPGKEHGGDGSRSENTPRVDIDWGAVQSKIPPLPPSRGSSSVNSSQVSPPDITRLGVLDSEESERRRMIQQEELDSAVKTQIGAVEQLEKLRANADTVREWAKEVTHRRPLPPGNPTDPTSQLESLMQPTFQSRPTPPLERLHAISPVSFQSTPYAQKSMPLVGAKWSVNTPPPPDTGMLEELSIGPSRPSLKETVSASSPAANHLLPSSASSKPLTGPPKSGEGAASKHGRGGGWPESSPSVDLSKWVMDWLSPSQHELGQRQKPRDQLTRQNLYPEDEGERVRSPNARTSVAAQQGSC